MIGIAEPILGKAEFDAVLRVLESGNLAQGPEVAAFESEFASALVCGRESVAVNSGTSALHLALLTLGLGPGDEVIVPSFTFAATANAVSLTGATPVFADIDPVDFGLSPEHVEALVSPRTAAVLPVHLYGHPVQIVRLQEICLKFGLLLVEDCAQAHGATVDGVPVGAWGDAAAFSFYPTKNMTTGEGGMIAFQDKAFARRARLLRNQGQERRYENEIVGFNNRMSDLHAAIGRVQLTRLPEWTSKRQRNAVSLNRSLHGVELPTVRNGCSHVYHQYTIRVPDGNRDVVRQELAEQGIETGVYYPRPVHQLPAFRRELDLPVTTRLAEECLSLPIHPSMSASSLRQVAEALNLAVEKAKVS